MQDLYYSDYIELDKILNSQHPKSFESPEEGNDEMLFIIIHQVYELWFKQILFELDLVRQIFIRDRINDNSDDLSKVVQKLKRTGKILELIDQQVSVLETMTALDFLEFRNVLLPASGFQSKQFRLIEARLGLKMDQRYKKQYYKATRRGSLSEADLQEVERAENEPTLKELIVRWLERMPYLDGQYWNEYTQSSEPTHADRHKFWADYREAYKTSLSGNETARLAEFDRVFFDEGRGSVPPAAMRAALRRRYAAAPGLLWLGDEDGANPYAALLAWADRIVCSPDSVNMVSEACATAAPVYVAEPGRATGRVRAYLDEMLRRGRIRAQGRHPEPFTAEPLRETARVAALVRERLGF